MTLPRVWTLALWAIVGLFWCSWQAQQPVAGVVLGCICLLLIVPISLRAPVEDGLLALIALVPFEYSVRRLVFPSFSPIDLVCIPLAISLVLRFGFKQLWRQTVKLFSPVGVVAWGLFLLWGLGTAYAQEGRLALPLRWAEFIFFLVLSASIYSDGNPNFPRKLARLLTFLGAALSVLVFHQFAQSHMDFTKAQATFGQKNIFAAYLSLVLPMTLGLAHKSRGLERWGSILAALLMAAAFVMAMSRGAISALIIAIVFLTIVLYRRDGIPPSKFWQLGVAAILLLGIGIFIGRTTQTENWRYSNGRAQYLATGLRIVSDHPIAGVGPGRFLSVLPPYLTPAQLREHEAEIVFRGHADFWQHLHNIYLQIAVDYGLVGLVLWLTGLLLILAPLFRQHADMSHPEIWAFPCVLLSVVAFLLHNIVDVLFVSSLDLIFAAYIVIARNSLPK